MTFGDLWFARKHSQQGVTSRQGPSSFAVETEQKNSLMSQKNDLRDDAELGKGAVEDLARLRVRVRDSVRGNGAGEQQSEAADSGV